MTTEDDFQAALDTCPLDFQTRLVFADWLQERSDPRAAGYRALGTLRLVPHQVPKGWLWYKCTTRSGISALKERWWNKLQGGERFIGPPSCVLYTTRRDAEDAAVCAFNSM